MQRRAGEQRRTQAYAASSIPLFTHDSCCATFVACYICSVDASLISIEPTIDRDQLCYYSNTRVGRNRRRACLPAHGLLGHSAWQSRSIPLRFAAELIRCPSVTPARGEVFDVLEAALTPLGFTVHRWVMGEPPDGPTENMVAIRGDGAPHFGFAGHLDVVPAGRRLERRPVRRARSTTALLVGRGANDMKSAIAAFVAALSRLEQTARHAVAADHRRRGRLCDLRHAADHRLAERAADPPRHDPDRRADLGRPPRRHGEDRPPRLGQHVDRGAGRPGPCRLSAPRRPIRSRRSPG